MFDEGQRLPSPYHRTKFESERLVRERTLVPWRVYRPAIVVGHSQTGEMDKIDGPYYFFKAIQRARHLLPEWFPLIGPELGWTNIVPVDYVAATIDHVAHADGLDGQAFHVTAPRSIRSGEAINAFARAAHAPQLQMRIDKRLTDALPKGVLSMLMQLPALKDIRRQFLADLGIPEEVLGHIALVPQFDTRDTERALAGSDITCPDLDTYADRLWDYWERNLDPDLFKDRSLSAALRGRTVVITGASSGIGRSVALKVAAAGGIPILVSRGRDKLEELRQEIDDLGGTAHVEPCDLSDMDAIGALGERLVKEYGQIDFLVNNAGRSIRRAVKLSYDRFHDYERTMQLNYFGAIKLVLTLLPHMTDNRNGHIVNVSSIGVQTNPPRFSAYVASKAALDAFTRIVATETLGSNVTFTTVHMPLVRTPMIAPTKIYDSFPTITPEEAADMICEGLRRRPKTINTRLGTFGEVAYALAPKAVDQVLHMAYKVFPDSSAAKGEQRAVTDGQDEQASSEAVALAHLMRGVHW
jgi:NAD(P)-dependent dehydrogenase (short-subunit alcohol dehydrogenase family)